MIVSVYVNSNIPSLDREFDYLVPLDYDGIILPGMRVLVPFGNKLTLGITIKTKETSEIELKYIDEVLDDIPTIGEELFNLAIDIRNKYFNRYFDSLMLTLPNVLDTSINKMYIMKNDNIHKDLVPFFKNGKLKYTKSHKPIYSKLLSDVKKGNLEVSYVSHDKLSIKTEKYYKLLDSNPVLRGVKQRELCEYLVNKDYVSEKELKDELNVSLSTIKSLHQKNIIDIEEREIYRDIHQKLYIDYEEVKLTPEQDRVINSIQKNEINLLHGISFSGKTEIYIKLIKQCMIDNKEAILIFPNLSLAYHLIDRFRHEFNDEVAFFHSDLNANEYYDEYRKVLNKEVKLVVGTSKAIFAPFENIGLIILDEEHSSEYYIDINTTFDVRYVAKHRANYHNSTLVFSSATPSIESFYNAKREEYNYIPLFERFNNSPLPKSYLVNMKDEQDSKNFQPFSRLLMNKIALNYKKGNKTMILLNKLSFSSYVQCRSCGHIVRCESCGIAMSYDYKKNALTCKHCDYKVFDYKPCPKCYSNAINYVGVGIQRLVRQLEFIFPKAKIYQLDSTFGKKFEYRDILNSFENDGDILVGTSLISKGLDIKDVTLVGIINADALLAIPSYSSTEETFNIINQVSGRAGRYKNGEVVIQSYIDDHYSINCAINNDYFSYYDQEITYRQQINYIPFYNLIKFTFISSSTSDSLEAATICKRLLLDSYHDIHITGPSEEVKRVNNKYQNFILLKYKRIDNISEFIKILSKQLNKKIELQIKSF